MGKNLFLTQREILRQAQDDRCHGEPVEPWIPRSRDCVAIEKFTFMPQSIVAANFSLRRIYAG